VSTTLSQLHAWANCCSTSRSHKQHWQIAHSREMHRFFNVFPTHWSVASAFVPFQQQSTKETGLKFLLKNTKQMLKRANGGNTAGPYTVQRGVHSLPPIYKIATPSTETINSNSSNDIKSTEQ